MKFRRGNDYEVIHSHAPELWLPERYRRYSAEHHADGHEKAAWCALCDHEVDAELIVESDPKKVAVQVKCHGQKFTRVVPWDSESETKLDALKKLKNKPFFDPMEGIAEGAKTLYGSDAG